MARRRADEETLARRSLRGLHAAGSGNAQAFGFSITITVTFGAVNSARGSPSLPELFGFAFAAVAAFSLLNLTIATLVKDVDQGREPDRVVLVATATDLLAVGAGLAGRRRDRRGAARMGGLVACSVLRRAGLRPGAVGRTGRRAARGRAPGRRRR